MYSPKHHATEANLCALCLLVSVLKVIGHFTVKPVVKTVAGPISDETTNLAMGIIHVTPELVPDHAAVKTLCPLPDKPEYGECCSGI